MKNKGFTLIELVLVLVLLGILAAFIIPNFTDLTGEAKTAAIRAAKGSLHSAAATLLAKNKAVPTSSSILANVITDGVQIKDGDNDCTFTIVVEDQSDTTSLPAGLCQ